MFGSLGLELITQFVGSGRCRHERVSIFYYVCFMYNTYSPTSGQWLGY